MLYFLQLLLSLLTPPYLKKEKTVRFELQPKFEIYKDKAGKYRFRLKAKNGEIILASQSYVTKGAAKNGIESVKKNAPHDERYERKVAKDQKPMFNLIATNNLVIGASEQYESTIGRENGIESVKANAPCAEVLDLT